MKLFNTATRKTDLFTPLHDNRVLMYSCGPTVYDHPHIGNWSAYIRWDLLARVLNANKFDVSWTMNITDVGHLVSDGDEGEDKLEKGAKRENISAWEVADIYTKEFIDGLNLLEISVDRDRLVKATDNIAEQIAMIETLQRKGYAYIIKDGVYFDSTKFKDYGKMARLDLDGMRSGSRIDIGDKKSPTDFALWKFSPKDSKRDMEWDSPWGKGFPGWHIECSAMAKKYLEDTIDIHTGGIDHIPIHHTNEIAQSESCNQVQFVRYWVHANFMMVDGHKISKSLGNIITLHDLSLHNYSPMDFKLYVLQSHYQTESNFTFQDLTSAKIRLNELRNFSALRFQPVQDVPSFSDDFDSTYQLILSALSDNLNSPLALAHLSKLVSLILTSGVIGNEIGPLITFIASVDELLGLNLGGVTDLTEEEKGLLNQRQQARSKKDWKESDRLRLELQGHGIELHDTKSTTIWLRSVS